MANLITWSDKLSVSVNSIDNQHKELVNMINDLSNAVTAGSGKGNEIIGDILKRLINYTASHFKHEESLMRTHNYPDFAKHKQEHDHLVKKVLDLQQKFESGNARMTIEVMMFLKNWLTKHIQGTDTKLGQFLSEKKVA